MRKALSISILFMLLICLPIFAEKTEAEHELGITKKLQYETARVLTFKDNKAVLDEIDSYDWLIKISEDTQDYLSAFNDSVDTYRSIAIKRERLQYVYNQKKYRDLAAAVPNVLSVATIALTSGNWKQAVIAVAGTTLNSITSYVSSKKNAELELLQSQWELDDEEFNAFNNLQTTLYNHLANIARNYDFGNEDFVSNKTLLNFVSSMNDDNGKPNDIALDCKKYEKELAMYPEFWSTLAIAMYDQGYYNDALTYIAKYEEFYEPVFYHDSGYTQIMLIKAYCLDATIADPIERVLALEGIISEIEKNLFPEDDWVPQYYCYLVYRDLAEYTSDEKYLEKAWALLFSILHDNVNQYSEDLASYLSCDYVDEGVNQYNEQIAKNETSIANLKEQKKSAKTKEKKNDVQASITKLENKNDDLKASSKLLEKSVDTELPPTEAFVISLAREFMDLSYKLDRKESVEYKQIQKKLTEVLEDEFFQMNYLGNNSTRSGSIEAKFTTDAFLFFTPSSREITFSVPLSYFTFVSDDFTQTALCLTNERAGIDVEVPFGTDASSGPCWSYKVVRPKDENSSMSNVTIEFTVTFNTSFEKIAYEKGADIPSLFVKFNGDDYPLGQELLLTFDSDSVSRLKSYLFIGK